ncbi:gliding motility protein GldM [Mucilaginibacter sp. L3T2-6]|uniref:type IX secretion system motor protein PorM/GldM n=1 Tax=Mucilaginibacter sp. L3T2-6 TaxID=3062491 RepID=UPI0026758212|nr:gliding motility protein GldM [Mucilaginibacter sp. L3T2-6]MDO3640447.1 gliding motility protein GldM [Mucilaginibacter sp. L3T2-6]MDV6213214.1 gliding motility protein GldM [Mucilaginibacter sp. L3T2-6]
MAGGKQTPRQRMMGILYLVLLGLVALSIPDSFLDALRNVTNSLDTSTKNVGKGIDDTYSAFEKTKLKEQAERAKPIYAKAKKASEIANSLVSYVQTLRDQLLQEGGGINPTTNDVDARDNLDISPRVMVTEGKGKELREKIEQTKEALLAQLNDRERQGINFSLDATEPKTTAGQGPRKSWEEAYFGDGIPLGAAMTTLAKIQTDAKSAENEVVKRILGEVDQAQVNLDQFAAVAVAPTSYVLVGQPYTADVFLTAYDSKLSPNITVGGSPLAVEAGKGKYNGSTSSEGPHTWQATINVKQTDGTIKTYTTPPQTYMVARPSAVVSPDKMNVLYIGVPNPVSVSAPGVPKEKLKVSISSGSLSGSNGKYTATVSSIGEATVSVSGELTPGKVSFLGSTVFRVKRIPPPKAAFAGRSGGVTSAANLRAQDRLFAKLENFEFDAKFNITRFTLLVAKPRQDVIIYTANGGELTSQMRTAMSSVTPGSTVVFKDIIAVGPDGVQQGLDPIAFSAN